MKVRLRRYAQTVKVLEEFLLVPKTWRYGYDISRNTELKSGTLYPILVRLAEHGWLETRWETTEAGRPPRHMYRLTANGMRAACEMVREDSKNLSRKLVPSGAQQ
jgi:PadR family transcriptional regulator PadR